MTLRDYLQGRYLRGLPFAAAFGVSGAISAFLAPKQSVYEFLGITVMLLSFLTFTIWLGRIPCPRCGKPLGLVAQNRGLLVMRLARSTKCRDCGLSLDDQMPARSKSNNDIP